MKIYPIIGSNIRYYRGLLNMSQDELAQKLDVTRATMNYTENGINRISIDRLIDIAKILNIKYTQLIEEDHTSEKPVPKKSCYHCQYSKIDTGYNFCSNLNIDINKRFYCNEFKKKETT